MVDEKAVDLGERLRRLREIRRISLRSLARESGLSANALSMIERGMSSPSVSTLYKLADAMHVPVTTFFGSEDKRLEIVHMRTHQGPTFPIVRGQWEGRGGEKFVGRVEPFVLTLEVGADSGTASMVHTGHEFVYCLGGNVEYEVEETCYPLNPGDSLLFAAHLSHRWRNTGKLTASLLIVLSGFDDTDQPVDQHLHKGHMGRRG
jgi:transcriptional regulator with XRE-family HTH domain/quercetin dioxygenase-like cupin family protein